MSIRYHAEELPSGRWHAWTTQVPGVYSYGDVFSFLATPPATASGSPHAPQG